MRGGRRSRSWAAWVASAFLHALIAALIWRAERRAAPDVRPPELVDLEVEIDEQRVAALPARAAPGRHSPAHAAPSSPSGSRRPTSTEHGEAQSSPSSSAAPASAAPSATDQGTGAPPIDLSFGALPDGVKSHVAGPAPQGALAARPHRLDVDELRVAFERQQDAVANVDRGRVDPVLYDYLRGARARFQTTAERLADDIAVGGGDAVRAWARGYLNTLDDVNRGALGARVDAPREGGGDTRNEKSPGADVLGQYGEAQRQAEAGAEERRAEVCLDVAAGRETAVVLRRTSGNAALDRLTLESFAKAVAARPVPPDARRGRACYELRISAYRMPPLPFVSCGVGPGGVTCVWPFKKVTSVRGRLLSVDYAPADAPDTGAAARARPSLLRKPR